MRICQAGGVDPAELGTAVALPDPALVVLAGASGSGKSVWAAEHYRLDEVVSSDRLRWWTPWALPRRGAVATWSWPGAAACPPSPCLSTPIRWSVAAGTAHA